MIIDGRAIAEDIYDALRVRRTSISKPIRLGIVVGGASPVIESFVRIKARAAAALSIEMVRVDIPENATTEEAVIAVKKLAGETDSIIVQLPLPKILDVNTILKAIPYDKDVDAINPDIEDAERRVHAPVALAVVEILNRSEVRIKDAHALVVGAGRLVGAPSASLLTSLGAKVSKFTLEEGSIEDMKEADIVVLGTGNPGFVKPEHLKDGVALIDAGASESEGRIRGDADPMCEQKASVFTPVPGGVGPIAVAMIFRNLLELVESEK